MANWTLSVVFGAATASSAIKAFFLRTIAWGAVWAARMAILMRAIPWIGLVMLAISLLVSFKDKLFLILYISLS